MFMYSYCYVRSILGIVFHCVVLCIVCVYMCTVLLPPGVNPIAVNKYISYHFQTSQRVARYNTCSFQRTKIVARYNTCSFPKTMPQFMKEDQDFQSIQHRN